MATATQLDVLNAVQYLSHRESLSYIIRWRKRFPHILIDYTIRWANSDDFFVPRKMRMKSAVVVQLFFSRQGCESMTCYPYTETGVIDFLTTPIGGFTQTSNTTVQYNQPACFYLDPSLASRNGHVQSVELRYTRTGQCVMVDSFTKAWMNTPYFRTSKHVTRGVDDVPGFDVEYDEDPAFPERIRARFNDAYCRRFGRFEANNGCSQPWYETFVSFILGESILSTFKLSAVGVFDDLRNFDYSRPSALLPEGPPPAGVTMLEEWLSVRDATVDDDAELGFLDNIFPMGADDELEYTANQGFRITRGANKSSLRRLDLMEKILARRLDILGGFTAKKRSASVFVVNDKTDEMGDDLESVIIRFLEDHVFIMSILTDLGFNVLESTVTNMLQQINRVLIPSLRRLLRTQSRRMTVALLGETYKAAMVHALNRAFIATVSTVARAMVKTVSAALSLVNLALMFVTIADLVLMVWDPFGYNNMFPRGYLDDLSTAFLSAHYESIDAPTRDLIEFLPRHFSNLVVDDEEEYFVDSMLHLADYLAALEVNSNGQILNLLEGEDVKDFDEANLVGASLATNDTWAYFKWFCARHDALVIKPSLFTNVLVGVGVATCIGTLLYYAVNHNKLLFRERLDIELLLLVLIVLCCVLFTLPSIQYYTRLAHHDDEFVVNPS